MKQYIILTLAALSLALAIPGSASAGYAGQANTAALLSGAANVANARMYSQYTPPFNPGQTGYARYQPSYYGAAVPCVCYMQSGYAGYRQPYVNAPGVYRNPYFQQPFQASLPVNPYVSYPVVPSPNFYYENTKVNNRYNYQFNSPQTTNTTIGGAYRIDQTPFVTPSTIGGGYRTNTGAAPVNTISGGYRMNEQSTIGGGYRTNVGTAPTTIGGQYRVTETGIGGQYRMSEDNTIGGQYRVESNDTVTGGFRFLP